MGFIKSIQTSISSQMEDQFREVIKCSGFASNEILKKVTTENGVITDQSRLFVQPSECAIFVDNGAIKDIITEPGMYFMDTSAPSLFQTNIFEGIGATFLESMKRIAYEGEAINQQAVYFISLRELVNFKFGTQTPILYKDPEWGPIEIRVAGEYATKINNPVNLLTNLIGDKTVYTVDELQGAITPYILSSIISQVSNLNVSFDEITKSQDQIGTAIITDLSDKVESFGVELTKITVTTVDVSEEVKNSMRERTAIKMKATSVNNDEADVYAKLNKAEAMKDLANNTSNPGTTVMGMGMGNMFSGMINEDENNNK